MSPKPARTCIVCREATGREELLRLVAAPDGSVVADLRANLPGRGAWIHPACVGRLEDGRKDPLSRALRTSADRRQVRERVVQAVIAALPHALSVAARAGALVGGHDRLAQALEAGEVEAVVVASDAAPRTLRSLKRRADEIPFVPVPWTADALGSQIGKGARAAVGLRRSRAGRPLMLQLRRLMGLGYEGAPVTGKRP